VLDSYVLEWNAASRCDVQVVGDTWEQVRSWCVSRCLEGSGGEVGVIKRDSTSSSSNRSGAVAGQQ
jgi:hypothetical protein